MREILREGRVFEVGGFVRDSLLRREIEFKDRDYLVTGITFDRLQVILKQYGRVDLVGRSFGVIKFTPYAGEDSTEIPGTCDISLPRAEKSTGPAHTDFDVDFNPEIPVEEDLLRRDFSINAIARDLDTGDLIDPYGGQIDLENKVIRMVSDRSFPEDPLRMLRAIQFAARFEFDIEPETYRALKDNVQLIESISPERIAEELNKMLVRSKRPSIGLRLIQESGMLKYIIPELEAAVGCEQPGGYHAHDVFEHTLRIVDACPPLLHVRLAGLFHDITKPIHKRLTETGASFYGHESSGAKVARKVLKRLRYSNEIIHDVSLLVERHMFTSEVGPKGLRRFIRRIGQRLIPDLLNLRRADVIAQGMGGTTDDIDEMEVRIAEEIESKAPFGRSDLKINGKDLIDMFNLNESPLIGEIVDYLMEQVLDNPDDNTPELLERHAREYLDKS
ncbi:MAG: HD domain-containing protein [candidate division Zixibacteria bacterium]|nr:HD domain-containing protein [candidate division Zixibacteria bacterium]